MSDDGNWKYGVVDLSTDSTTVSSIAAEVKGVYVNTTLSAHACPLKDDTTTVVTIPASSSAGTFINLYGTEFLTSLVVDPHDSATGSITVLYKRLSPI